MRRAAQDLTTLRKYYTENARQVQVEGVADTVAVGYVRELAGRISYVVFYGKQGKPAKHYSARDVAQAEQRITEALTAAGQVAQRKAEARKQPRLPYHESTREGVTYRSYTTAGTAQLIREALKAAFPGVKFSVTSDTFANGSSVRIEYTDGPSSRQVEAVYSAFESGHFNSQKDMYEYHREPTVINAAGELACVSYGAKYISSSRNYSAAYGFFLNSLDLRQRPSLTEQFAAFYKWHSGQRYNMQASWGEHAGTYTVSSDSSFGDLERFAEALSHQGHAVQLTEAGPELTLIVQPHAVQAGAGLPPTQEPAGDHTAREYHAAEMHWLRDSGQDSTDREFEAAERSWLAAA